MTRVVEVLRLSGKSPAEALQEADSLLRDRSRPDLRSLLVVDDTRGLPGHADAFGRLLTSRQVPYLVCVCVGPPEQAGQLRIPGNVRVGQDSPVLWVGDELGIDWPLAMSAVPVLHPSTKPTGLDCLIDVLSSVEVFERVRKDAASMPHGVAAPGIRLAAMDADVAAFDHALSAAIHQLTAGRTDAKPRSEEPFAEVARIRAADWRQRDGGLPGARECVSAAQDADHALAKLAGLTGLLAPGRTVRTARKRVIAVGQALGDLRSQVTALFGFLRPVGDLTQSQRALLREAGFPLADSPIAPDSHTTDRVARAQKLRQAIVEALRGGGTLPETSARLTATESRLRLPDLDFYRVRLEQGCPQPLVERLRQPTAIPRQRPWLALTAMIIAALAGAAGIAAGLKPAAAVVAAGATVAVLAAVATAAWSRRRSVDAWRRALAPGEAATAADTLDSLVADAADRVWSADPAAYDAVRHARIAVDAICDHLREYARACPAPTSGGGQALSHVISPTLIDLVLTVLDALPGPDAAGPSTDQSAREATQARLEEWARSARDRGPLALPTFGQDGAHGLAHTATGQAAVQAAVGQDVHGTMWQLCMPGELAMLDIAGTARAVPFAPRAMQPVLPNELPHDIEWTSSGYQAGLLRLVPLRKAAVTATLPVGDPEQPG